MKGYGGRMLLVDVTRGDARVVSLGSVTLGSSRKSAWERRTIRALIDAITNGAVQRAMSLSKRTPR